MNTLFSDFQKVSKLEWEEKLRFELKGADFNSALINTDEIEGFISPAYAHSSDAQGSVEVPNMYPFKRSSKSDNNEWNNGCFICVKDEKTANERSMELLMSGCTSLVFDIQKRECDWNLLFDQIGFEFIETQFVLSHLSDFEFLNSYFKNKKGCKVLYRIDFLSGSSSAIPFEDVARLVKNNSAPFCFVNAFEIQQCGANITQELSYALATGNEYLVKLLEAGYVIDEAVKCIHFSLGIGANYFNEIAKIRAFRKAWSQVVNAYNPKNFNACKCYLTSEVGYLNKSLKDPYTNLLRQTTEAMSAISGGIDTLIVHPYDSKSVNGISTISARMALNISLILKEESYFDKVIDPIGGSYSIENLTEQIAENSWKLFQELDSKGGIQSNEAKIFLQKLIHEKVELRKENVASGKKMLIGVNKYMNPLIENNTWLEKEVFFGLEKIVLERDI